MTRCIAMTCCNFAEHPFPRDVEMRRKWLRATRAGDSCGLRVIAWHKRKYIGICSEHFTLNDYVIKGKSRSLLKTAVPSIFPCKPKPVFNLPITPQLPALRESPCLATKTYSSTNHVHCNITPEPTHDKNEAPTQGTMTLSPSTCPLCHHNKDESMCCSEENSGNEMEDDSETLLGPPAGRLASRERRGDVTAAARPPPPSQLVGPRDKFDFVWRPFPDSQIDPDLRRESFTQRESELPYFDAVPYRAFIGIWNYNLMQHIAKETNDYAEQLAAAAAAAAGAGNGARGPAPARTAWWQDTTVDELYTYFAIIIAMGIVEETNIKDYWNKCESLLHTPGFPTTMPHDRFVLLSKCIRYASDIYDTQEMSPSQAKIAKIQPVIDYFNWKYEEKSKLSRNIVIHEGQSESDLILLDNQFVDNETAPVIKTHEVCDSLTGYLWRFEIQGLYEDHIEQPHDPVSGSMPSLVFRLLDGVGLGHTVWLEGASPALARELKSRGLDCAGPLRPGPLPRALRGPRGGGARGCTAGDVDLVVSSSDVMISTFHGAAGVAADYERHRRDREPAPRPDERRTNVWYRKLLRKLLNDSVSNLYVLYKAETGKSCRAFKRRLVGDLLAKHSRAQTPLPYTVQHFPARISRISGLRRLCIVCKQPTEWLCKNCQLLMCVEDCFEEYHAEEITQPDRRFWH